MPLGRLSHAYQVTQDPPCMCNCAISFHGEIVTAVRLSQKVSRGAQDFTNVVSRISQSGSVFRAFTECTHWHVCTMAGHTRTRDTPTRFRFSGIK